MELKCCPFCGQDASVIYRNYSARLRKYFVWVECEACGARSKASTSDDDPADNDEWSNTACRRCTASWNMRAGCSNAEQTD